MSDLVETIALVPASKAAQERVGKTLASVIKALPKPPHPYVSPSSISGEKDWVEHVASRVGTLEGSKLWIPLEAWAEQTYELLETLAERGDTLPSGWGDHVPGSDIPLEARIAINGSRGLSPGLGSEGAAPLLFDKGALAIEQTLIGADGDSRVALPLSAEAAAAAPTLLRIYLVDPKLEATLRKSALTGSVLPRVDISQLAAEDQASVRSIIVEYYGGKRDVEALARRVDTKALRKLLTP